MAMQCNPWVRTLLALSVGAGAANAQATLSVPSVYSSIQAAIDDAQTGDTVEIAAGTYDENLVIAGLPEITLRATGKVVVQGQSGGPILTIQSSWVSIDGLRFIGLGREATEVQHGIVATSSSTNDALILRRAPVSDVSGSGIVASGSGRVFVEAKSRIERCGATGLLAQGASFVRVQKVTVQDCDGDGLVMTDGADVQIGVGEHDPDSERVIVRRVAGAAVTVTVPGNQFNNTSIFSAINVKDCGSGISVAGELFTIDKCSVKDVVGDGLSAVSTETFPDFSSSVTRNRVTRAGGVGLSLAGTELLVEANTIKTSGASSVRVAGSGAHTIQRNTIRGSLSHGITLGTEVGGPDGVRLLNNTITKSKGDGLALGTTGNDVHENTIRGAGGVGLRLLDGGNDVRANSVQGSTGFDLSDTAPRDTNVYDGNTFGTIDDNGHQPL